MSSTHYDLILDELDTAIQREMNHDRKMVLLEIYNVIEHEVSFAKKFYTQNIGTPKTLTYVAKRIAGNYVARASQEEKELVLEGLSLAYNM